MTSVLQQTAPSPLEFALAVAPYIALGGILRAWEDLIEFTHSIPQLFSPFILTDAFGTARNLLFITPLIYVFMFVLALAALLVAKLIERYATFPYHKTWLSIGALFCLLGISQLRLTNTFALLVMLGIFGVWALVIAGSRIAFSSIGVVRKTLTKENTLLLVHMFDATTTFVALQFFPYFEQHVVAGTAISFLGPAGIFVLKLPVVAAVLYYLDKELSKPEDLEKRTFIKIAILVLGLGPGLRNFLRLVMGV
jgi:uncharacterized membrane protein